MKKKLILICTLVLLILLGYFALTHKTSKNELFTDDFFSDVVEIKAMVVPNSVVTAEQMEPAIKYLQSLELAEVDQHLGGDDEDLLGGASLLTFTKFDGTEEVFLYTHGAITCTTEMGKRTFLVEEGNNLNIGLKEAFDQGVLNSQE